MMTRTAAPAKAGIHIQLNPASLWISHLPGPSTLPKFTLKLEMSEAEEMRVDPARAQALISQLSSVKERVGALANGRNVSSVAKTTTNSHMKRRNSPHATPQHVNSCQP
jgi:hypothetical protein